METSPDVEGMVSGFSDLVKVIRSPGSSAVEGVLPHLQGTEEQMANHKHFT